MHFTGAESSPLIMFFVNAQTLFSSHEDFLIIITENKYNQIKHEM